MPDYAINQPISLRIAEALAIILMFNTTKLRAAIVKGQTPIGSIEEGEVFVIFGKSH